MRWYLPILFTLTSMSAPAQQPSQRPFTPEDIHRIRSVGDLAISPDGDWVAYTVGTTNIEKDESSSDLFMVRWDGSARVQLTHTEGSESHPRFSPDGKYLGFIAARDAGADGESKGPASKSQIHLLNRAGGEAQRLTALPGGVSSFEWSPDGSRLILVSKDPAPDEDAPPGDEKTPKPIVVDRYQFKRDREGYLGDRYQRLYVLDVATRQEVLLTPGAFDSTEPSWSPDGRHIAFSSKRGGDPDRHENTDIYVIEAISGASATRLTDWEGSDDSPSFSPDGTKIAYLQGGPAKYSGYDPSQLAIISTTGGSPFLPTEELDRHLSQPQWSADGSKVHFLFVDDRLRIAGEVPVAGGEVKALFPNKTVPGVVRSYQVGANGIAGIVTFPNRPPDVYRLSDGKALTDENRALLDEIDWAEVQGVDAVGKDDVRVGALLVKPPGFTPGTPYPTIALIHGGPVAQDGFEFDAMSQVLAAQGYLVVNPNYRGSHGRGRDFARAIYADWGNLEIQDIHTVVDHLVAEGLADPNRLGIGGWSYGGMNTNYAIATDTRFRAAVSGASISNMITGYGTDQYIRQYENELGLPWEGIETYLKISYPFFKADRIKTPTLFLCGEKDFNVPLINSEQMYQALRSLDVPTRLVIYPGQFHGLSKPSYVQDRLERMIDWYQDHLGETHSN